VALSNSEDQTQCEEKYGKERKKIVRREAVCEEKKEKKESKKRLPQEDYGVTGINNCLLVFHPHIGDVESQFFIFIFF